MAESQTTMPADELFALHPLPWTHHLLLIKDANGRQVIHTGGLYSEGGRLHEGSYLSGLTALLVELVNSRVSASLAPTVDERVIEIVAATAQSSLWNANGYRQALADTLKRLRSLATSSAATAIEDGLCALLESYTQPCAGNCNHSQCPLLRELYALRIKATLERAQLTVKPIVDREKKGEEIGDLMNMRLNAPASPASPTSSDAWATWFDRLGKKASAEVVNATAELVTNERLAALVQAKVLPGPVDIRDEAETYFAHAKSCTACGPEGFCSEGLRLYNASATPPSTRAKAAAEEIGAWIFMLEQPLTSETDLRVATDHVESIILKRCFSTEGEDTKSL